MKTWVRYGKNRLEFSVPDGARVIQCPQLQPLADPTGRINQALENPVGSESLATLANGLSQDAKVVVVISDITRPVPNQVILEPLLATLEACGLKHEQITILIATGMHRPSTPKEKIELVGERIARCYRIVDHQADKPQSLVALDVATPHGRQVWINRQYYQADLKIVTGFIEPHMMAGYSGGRKAICPGLVNLDTIQQFHGPDLLANPKASAGVLEGNPCHQEALAVARAAGSDFLINVIVNPEKEILHVVAGQLERAHAQGVGWLEKHCTISDVGLYDVVVTCGGGYPLDATFYQAVKGMVLAEPLIKPNGTMVIASECSEGIGSEDYQRILFQYSHSWRDFLKDILARQQVQRDQWELQVQCRVLEKISKANLLFVTDGLEAQTLAKCNVTLPTQELSESTRDPAALMHLTLDGLARRYPDASWAVVPDGPYILVKPPTNSR